ncbi:UDP-N-acetylmuramoyl-tripeptide--D-alanyl-D-alanine ligase [Cellulosilyticum sp. I15G10I2]|uniref:UDP-N-acetylmuramoyl-tripeptide--D-alanyl-D- alanine ligase n=1 Tax=Cellulosilyticum sp. I15G10I2 TaxID=1892843 RepID=UPI000A6A18F3|nr:UDP-N-acetylmuramoyl-tripeptide--D-alanyl-D-alanine ligase [Cellulosilyticum sp. I15G10I2]
MELRLQDILEALQGKCLNPNRLDNNIVQSISTDSRQIGFSSLFIPLKGENFDGHQFIPHIFEKGAVATLTEYPVIKDERLCTIYVENTQEALLRLAKYYRSLFQIPVIGITGSVGKTSTKEIIAAVLSARFNVHKTAGNYNNEIGLPLTLFKLERHHEVAVVEMGMNHFGEIHKLSLTACPQIGVITNIGTSHIENLGSREGILKAKLEILDGLDSDGLLIINGDNDLLSTIEEKSFKVIRYGMKDHQDYYAKNIISQADKTTAEVFTPNAFYQVAISALGEHMIYNTLAAIAIAEELGLTRDEILKGLASYQPSQMRMHIKTYDNKITIMDDTYNASPDSMEAALKVLKEYPVTGRRIAVLGDMLEMGSFAANLHEQVGKYASLANIDLLCAVGKLAEHIYNGANNVSTTMQTLYFATKDEFLSDIENIVHSGDTILFKASRGMHFEEMVEAVGKVKCDEK